MRFWTNGRQPGNNPESHKFSGQVLINAVIGNLKSWYGHMSGNPANREDDVGCLLG
jgi:hypothetical protein